MCGIAGIFTLERPTTAEDVAAVKRMMAAQVHRGPDGEGLSQATHAVLGHRRLSIIDLSDAGRQPMSNEDGTVWVTYNGEVYNFAQLRDGLSHDGHDFRSRTDTEVLVHGYEEWGIEGLLARLRGMFAFAIYDSRASRPSPCLFLAKDRFGIKPLYYGYQPGEQVVFASEVRAIIKSGLVKDEQNEEALVRFLQLGSVPVPLTTVKGIQALPAAHYAVITEQGLRMKQYWDLVQVGSERAAGQRPPTFEEATRATSALLEEAVKLHLISDVPLGVFLSGGLDSSALVAVASRFRQQPLTTVSIVFEEPQYSEARYSRMVAQQYGTDHHERLLRGTDFIDSLPKVLEAMDQPTVDGVNTYLVSKAAKEAGLTVVLSGTGGDEVFLGYSHFKKAGLMEEPWRLFRRLPNVVRRSLLNGVNVAGALAGMHGLEKLEYLKGTSTENVYLLFRGLFALRQVQNLLGLDDKELDRLVPEAPTTNGLQHHSLVDALALSEFGYYLQNQLLRDTDVMSMAWSIETRVPFLDHRLVEHVASLPLGQKILRTVNKPALLAAVGNGLPREIWDRRKMGFTLPFDVWVREHAESLLEQTLASKVLDGKAVEDVWRKFRERQLHWSRPWALLVASQWGHGSPNGVGNWGTA